MQDKLRFCESCRDIRVYVVVRPEYPKPTVTVDAGDKACCGRVYDHGLYGIPGGKLFQCGIVFLIGAPLALGSCIIIVFLQPVPDPSQCPHSPKEDGFTVP